MGDGVVHLFTPKVTIMVIGLVLVVLVMVLVAAGGTGGWWADVGAGGCC